MKFKVGDMVMALPTAINPGKVAEITDIVFTTQNGEEEVRLTLKFEEDNYAYFWQEKYYRKVTSLEKELK